MKWSFIIAWRNLWRSPRRTGVILVSIVVGIFMMLLLASLMWGMVQGMLQQALANLTGHVQIHHPAYMDDPVVDNRLDDLAALEAALAESVPEGSAVAWRMRMDVVASNARHSGGLNLVGADIQVEQRMTFLASAAVDGSLPEPGSNDILVGRQLLEDYETRIGHKLILTARAADGTIASRSFRISGSFDTFLQSSETAFAFADRSTVAEFLAAPGSVTEVAVLLPDIDDSENLAASLRERLNRDRYEVLAWPELMPLVSAYISVWDLFSYIWGVVIFTAMAFGLVNTLLMAVYERIREFGLVQALGMLPRRILGGVLLESFLLLLTGLAAGNLAAALAIGWLSREGIDLAAFSGTTEMLGLSRVIYPQLLPGDLFFFNAMVFGLGMLVSLYPAWKASRFTPVEAMTHFN